MAPTFPEEEASAMRFEFWSRGYVIIEDVVGEKILKKFVEMAEKREYIPIFNRIYHESENDNKRLMSKIGLESTRFHTDITSLMQSVHPLWELHKWTIIKSLPGGMPQDVHRDFPTFETAHALDEKSWIQGSLFVAIEDATELDIFPEAFTGVVAESKRTCINLARGSMIIFRGDLPHAGVSYSHVHHRLHCYLRVKGFNQKDDSTEAVPMYKALCFFCLKMFPIRKTRDNHARYCAKNPRKHELAQARKRKHHEGGTNTMHESVGLFGSDDSEDEEA